MKQSKVGSLSLEDQEKVLFIRDLLKSIQKTRNKTYQKLHKNLNKELYLKYRRDNARHRTKTDVNFRLSSNLRHRLWSAIKAGSHVKDLGCTIEELRVYLESKFQNGMSWENYGVHGWHLDHIKPLSKFDLSDRGQFLLACHYSNLQPLWAEENIRKGNR